MQKYLLLFIFLLFLIQTGNSQVSFSDDFDSYNDGDYLAQSNSSWTTWSNKPGTSEDAKITSERSLSPNNSVRIFSTSPSGGPTDLILPFGAKYSTGTFIYKMGVLIPKDKGGYFNFQAERQPGQQWAMDAFFYKSGFFEFQNGATTLFRGQYPTDTWFDLEININLSGNVWRVIIDGECLGTFSNPANSIASIDFYATSNADEMFIDDVFYSYDPDATSYTFDVGFTSFNWESGKLAGNSDYPTCTVRNNGTTTINSMDILVTQPGEEDILIPIEDMNLKQRKSELIYLPELTLKGGLNNITLKIISINGQDSDDEECNNFYSFVVDAVTPATDRKVLVEESTGTWCVWCPRGAVFMDKYNDLYNGYFIPVAVHGGSATEPMRVPEYDTYIAASAYPNCRVNRGSFIDPSDSEEPFLEEIVKTATARLIPGARYDQDTRLLEISVETEFIDDAVGNFYVSLILTEDGVRGTTSGYNQANAYSGGGAGVMGGYEALPNPVPANLMVYNHVGRAVSGLSSGTANAIRGPISAGEKVVKHFSFNLDESWDATKINIIPVLMRPGDVYINANLARINKAIDNGYVVATEQIILNQNVNVYPNPADNYLNIEFELNATSDVTVNIFDTDGKSSLRKKFTQQQGNVFLTVPTESMMPGIYMVRIDTNQGSRYEKVVITR